METYIENHITREDLEAVLKADKGPAASLEKFEILDMTKPGDNHASYARNVKVNYSLRDSSYETSYFVKILRPGVSGLQTKLYTMFFEKEIGFYKSVLPLLNSYLRKAEEPDLCVPKFLYNAETSDCKILYFKDMREQNFKMHARSEPLDYEHTKLVLRELAKLHVASALFIEDIEKEQGKDVISEFPMLADASLHDLEHGHSLLSFMASGLVNQCEVFAKIPSYKFVQEYIKKNEQNLLNMLKRMLHSEYPYRVITHGDCWKNNYMFRYDEYGLPDGCCMLDFQIVRIASPGCDLSMFLFSSMDGELQTQRMRERLTATYYIKSVELTQAYDGSYRTLPMEIYNEIVKRDLFGFTWSMTTIPYLLLEAKYIPTIEDFFGADGAAVGKNYLKEISNAMDENGPLTKRVLDMIETLKRHRFFDQ